MIEAVPLLAWPIHQRSLTILIFHRVLPAADPFRPGEAVAAVFGRQMRFLSEYFAVLPLADAAEQLTRGSLPARACCITFDDGYADNLTVALPILERYRLPATVFVATGYLDGGRMFNDSVIDAIATADVPSLDLRELALEQYPLSSVAQRRDASQRILERLKYLPPAQRDVAVERLVVLAKCPLLATDIMLRSEQVAELSRHGIEIGGHTVAHTILTTLDDARARTEMATGKQQLEHIVGRPVRMFAYPNGRPGRDYAARHAAMAREVGFELAVTTASGVAQRTSDPYQLPRFTPWGASVAKLGARMMRNAWTGKAFAVC